MTRNSKELSNEELTRNKKVLSNEELMIRNRNGIIP